MQKKTQMNKAKRKAHASWERCHSKWDYSCLEVVGEGFYCVRNLRMTQRHISAGNINIFIPCRLLPRAGWLFPMESHVISLALLLQNSLTVNQDRGTEKNACFFTTSRWALWSFVDLHVGLHLALTFLGVCQKWLEDTQMTVRSTESELSHH